MSDGARGRSHGFFSSIREAIFGRRRPNAAAEEDDALWDRREVTATPAALGDEEMVVRSHHWDLGEDDVKAGIAHADAAFERGFRPREVDVVDAAAEPEQIDDGADDGDDG